MSFLGQLGAGFAGALAPGTLLCLVAGCLAGTLVGVLPGIGPVVAIAILLPATASLSPLSALVLLAAVYYGAQYGGSTPAILANRPGVSSAAAGSTDGHQMALQGRAGAALAAAALGSFAAGCGGALAIALAAAPLTRVAFEFGPPEYFALVIVGLVGAAVLASGSLLKAIAMAVLGLLLGLVGQDAASGNARYTFELPQLAGGLPLAVLAMGLFGHREIVARLARGGNDAAGPVPPVRMRGLVPDRGDLRAIAPAVLRGTLLGSVFGVLPGGGALLAAFAAYAIEKRIAAAPGEIEFGKGNLRGVAAPESANNAGAQTSMLPLLTLGIPTNPAMALVAGAMALHGLAPGPQVITSEPALFWGLVASMWAGNLVLLAVNLPGIAVWSRLLAVPYRWVFPAIVLACALAAYSIRRDPFDVALLAACGALGHVLARLGCEPAPLLLGVVLGPAMEEHLRRTLAASNGDWGVFLTRPVSAGLLAAAVGLLLLVALPSVQAGREEAFVKD